MKSSNTKSHTALTEAELEKLTFPSLHNATASGLSLAVLRWAKAHGAPGFANGRVMLMPVVRWLAENPPPGTRWSLIHAGED